MSNYRAPVDEMLFVLHEVLGAPEQWGGSEHLAGVVDAETARSILEAAALLSTEQLSPLNSVGDEEGCSWNDGQVKTPSGFDQAFRAFAEGGWCGLTGSPEWGGSGMPKSLAVLVEEMWFAANTSFALIPSLTSGAALAISAHGAEELKQRYLDKLYSGQWAGTMCLTEAHSGTDLGLIHTRAADNGDGSYAITGSKIFITGGEQNLTENIIHLVLAKLPDAPSGSKGISMFLVPKRVPREDGSLSDGNGISCGSLEHKMGIHGSPTCVLNFDQATGWLVGEPNRGLQAMFTMMNYERLGIGLQGIGLADASYQCARDYAFERRQGRAPTGAVDKDQTADAIIEHPDVRRMLMTMRAYTEANRCFAVYTAMLLDTVRYSANESEAARAEQLVSLVTPLCKAFFTDKGFEGCVLGQQVLGGHGYIREWGQEQRVRDARIAQIYEGTNGIQALDLMLRKVVANGGETVTVFAGEIQRHMDAVIDPQLQQLVLPLQRALQRLLSVTHTLIERAGNDMNQPAGLAVDYLQQFGLVAGAYMWLRMALVAQQKLSDGEMLGQLSPADYEAKLKMANFYMSQLLPEAETCATKIEAGSDAMMSLSADQW